MSDHKGSCPHIPTGPDTLGPVSGVRLPTFGAKQVSIAGDVAVGYAVMLEHRKRISSACLSSYFPTPSSQRHFHPRHAHLCVTPSRQGLLAALAPEARSVPVPAQRHHLLRWWWREVMCRPFQGQARLTPCLVTPCPLPPVSTPLQVFCWHLPK